MYTFNENMKVIDRSCVAAGVSEVLVVEALSRMNAFRRVERDASFSTYIPKQYRYKWRLSLEA